MRMLAIIVLYYLYEIKVFFKANFICNTMEFTTCQKIFETPMKYISKMACTRLNK